MKQNLANPISVLEGTYHNELRHFFLGALTLLCGVVLFIVGRIAPAKVATFFDINNDNVLMELKARQGVREEDYQECYNESEVGESLGSGRGLP
jgi:hypothetical protein